MERYGWKCLISGCEVVDVLEAAHVRPYRGVGDNHPSNGVLLRSDLHTLFDLDLLGIDPTDGRVCVSRKLLGTEYEAFHGKFVISKLNAPPDRDALEIRWNEFLRREGMPKVER
jgi:putative restriction endonuclease